MATRYALLEFTNSHGTHQPGDKIEVSTETEIEKVADERLISGGVYSKTQPRNASARPAARGEQETK